MALPPTILNVDGWNACDRHRCLLAIVVDYLRVKISSVSSQIETNEKSNLCPANPLLFTHRRWGNKDTSLFHVTHVSLNEYAAFSIHFRSFKERLCAFH